MLSMANKIFEDEFILYKPLTYLVIKKAPSVIKSLLYQETQLNTDWHKFLKTAEESAWLIVNQDDNEKVDKQIFTHKKNAQLRINYKQKKSFYNTHNKKLSKTKLKQTNIQTNDINNKNTKNKQRQQEITVIHHNIQKNSKNPFYKQIIIDNIRYNALLDTGANISLISKEILKNNKNREITNTNINVQTATGEKLKILGYIDNVIFTLKNRNHKNRFYVVDSDTFQTIIGANFIKNNLHVLEHIDNTNYITVNKKAYKTMCLNTTEHLQNSIFQTYQDIFQTELSKYNLCTLTKHYIDTGTTQPRQQFNSEFPIFQQELIDNKIKELIRCGMIKTSDSKRCSRLVPIIKKR